MLKTRHLLLLSILAASCGGTPINPSPTPPVTPPVDPDPVVVNNPPVIGAFTVQGTRTNEPPNFADASEAVPVAVAVTDAESQIGDLTFNWTSNAGGTFIGSGAKVTWKAPATVDAPVLVTLSVEVVETYTSQGKPVTNNPKGSVTLSLHDSVKEVGALARQFLLDFSDSNLKDVPYVMRNFGTEPNCITGTLAETNDVINNRRDFEIKSWVVDLPNTSVNFGSACPIPERPSVLSDACARVHTDWYSVAIRDLDGLAKGESAETHGVDYIAAFYYPSQRRWNLCDSQYPPPPATSLRGRLIPSLVP